MHKFRSHLVIIDHMPHDANEHVAALIEHRNKCDAIRDFFQRETHCRVRLNTVHPGDNADTFNDYIDGVLIGKGVGDLIILYHHGRAGKVNGDYVLCVSTSIVVDLCSYL